MRKVQFTVGEYYHIYNRGVEKRTIFQDNANWSRFMQSIEEFNVENPIGSIYENKFRKKHKLSTPGTKSRLVDVVAYCLNPNHYHLILTPLLEKGIEKFIQKLGGGYTRYFNEKYERNGVLFQGPFKAKHIASNEYLLYLSAYVNLNNRIHQLSTPGTKLDSKFRSSWGEYLGKNSDNLCSKSIILDQFDSVRGYKIFAEDVLKETVDRRKKDKERVDLLLE